VVEGAAELSVMGEPSGMPLWTVFLALALACLVAETLVTTRWKAALSA
jgi:hypothetical protein